MEQIITIESKTESKNPKCTIYETDQGKMSAWDQLREELDKHIGKPIKVEVAINGNFKNIKAYLGEVTKEDQVVKDSPKQEATVSSEPAYRLNVKQTTKGHHHWDATVRADTTEELTERIQFVSALADEHCKILNGPEESVEDPKDAEKAEKEGQTQ